MGDGSQYDESKDFQPQKVILLSIHESCIIIPPTPVSLSPSHKYPTVLHLCPPGKVYIAGGFNGDQCLCSAECYDPCIDQWTMIRSMSCTRSGLAVCVYNGTIYVVGGFDGESRLKSGNPVGSLPVGVRKKKEHTPKNKVWGGGNRRLACEFRNSIATCLNQFI
jgi:hypothetical protein